MRLVPFASAMCESRRIPRSNAWRLRARDCENTLGRIAPRKAPALSVLLCSFALYRERPAACWAAGLPAWLPPPRLAAGERGGFRKMDHRPHIVVVEDEADQREWMVEDLSRHNLRVSGAESGAELRRLVERDTPAVVLLDIRLSGENGLALARWLRETRSGVGIIMATGVSETVDRVVGLEIGADDYISKPFDPRELLARVRSLLRRVKGDADTRAGPRVAMARRVLDLEKGVLVDPETGGEEALTAGEFYLLRLFAENPNTPLHRDWLPEVTSHREMEQFDRAIDLRITRLRRKIEIDPSHPEAIRTVRGVGYMFARRKT
jgi:DNA-binding response OmpR family regulator